MRVYEASTLISAEFGGIRDLSRHLSLNYHTLCTRCLVFGDSIPGPKSARRAEWSGSRKRWLDGARYRGRIDHSRRSSCEELKVIRWNAAKFPKFKGLSMQDVCTVR